MTPLDTGASGNRWMQQYTYLHAWHLQLCAQLQVHRRICVAAALLLSAVLLFVLYEARYLVDILGPHLLSIEILVVLHSSAVTHTRRIKWTHVHATDWLSTLPISARQRYWSVALHAALFPVLMLGLLTLVAVLLLSATHAPALMMRQWIGGLCTATLAGTLMGWWVPPLQQHDIGAKPVALIGRGARPTASLNALSSWARSYLKVLLTPRSLARFLMPAMLLLPLGVTGNVAIAILALWTLALYLGALLWSMVVVLRQAEAWLRPTPVSVCRIAWEVMHRPLLAQAQWTLAASVVVVALGGTPASAVRIAEWWLSMVSLTSGFAIVHSQQPAKLAVKLVLGLFGLLILERLRHHVALVVALLVSGLHLRRCARA